MKTNVLSKETENKMAFVGFIIPQFADAFKMDIRKVYRYLKQYGGMDYILDCWWALHVDNPYWAVRDIFDVCEMNGGKLR
jgi:hypothetical protein